MDAGKSTSSPSTSASRGPSSSAKSTNGPRANDESKTTGGPATSDPSRQTKSSEPEERVSLTSEAQGGSSSDASARAVAENFASAFDEPEEANSEAATTADDGDTLSAEDEARVAEYREARELYDRAEAENFPDSSITPELADAAAAISDVQSSYDDALNGVTKSQEDYAEVATSRTELLANEGALVSDTELASLREFADGRVGVEQGKVDEATAGLIDQIEDPVFAEHLQSMDPAEQADFFADMAGVLPGSEQGREWISGLNDGLAELGRTGETDHPAARVAAGLRESLEGRELERFEANMGSMVGLDMVARPEGSFERLGQVAEAMGVPASEIDGLRGEAEVQPDQLGTFSSSVATSAAIYNEMSEELSGNSNINAGQIVGQTERGAKAVDALAEVGEGILATRGRATRSVVGSLVDVGQRIGDNGRLLGLTSDGLALVRRGAQAVGKTAGAAADIFSVAQIVNHTVEGNYNDAAYEGMALAGGLLAGAASGPVAAAGYALIGASMLAPAAEDSIRHQNFVNDALAHTFGDSNLDNLRESAIAYAPSYGSRILNEMKPEGMSVSEYFNERLGDLNPDDPTLDREFWSRMHHEYNQQEQQRLEQEAMERLMTGG